jgi:hypothetical protein
MSRGCELRNDLATVSHQNSVTRSHVPEVLAQAVFEFANAGRLHSPNVASGSYIVKRGRGIAEDRDLSGIRSRRD